MKRLLSLVLLVALLLPMVGMAELDFANMTDEELLLLNQQIVTELFSRQKTALLPVGKYIIGEHIPEGDYLFLWDDSYETEPIYYWYENNNSIPTTYDFIRKLPSSSDRITLKKGDILTVERSHVYLMITAPIIIEFK